MNKIKKTNVIETVTCYIVRDKKVLMLFRNKKKVDINKNKWIGVGGHIERGETPVDAVIREVKEETNYNLIDFQKKAIIIFNFGNEVEVMHLFVATKISGCIRRYCDEGTLQWFTFDELKDIPMWEGDRLFIPKVLNDEPYFEMVLYYDKDKLIKHELLDI